MFQITKNAILFSVIFSLTTTQYTDAAPDRRLPRTTNVKQQLTDVKNSIDSIAAKASRAEKAVESARKQAQDVAKLISTIRRLDDKIGRIQRQLKTLTRIPQLRLLKPLVDNLDKVRGQIHKVRKKADQANRDYLQPMITKLKQAEKKLEYKVIEIRNAASQTSQANQKLVEFTSFVKGRGYQRYEVNALESMARPISSAINPARQSIGQLDRELGGIEREFNALAKSLSGLSRAKGAVSKLDSSLKKADKVAGDIDKVLSKSIKINLGFKKFTFTVRKVLESPGKIIDAAIKPLQKLASKALSPVMKKVRIKIDFPSEITALNRKFDELKNMANTMQQSVSRIEKSAQRKISQGFLNQVQGLNAKTTANLARR